MIQYNRMRSDKADHFSSDEKSADFSRGCIGVLAKS